MNVTASVTSIMFGDWSLMLALCERWRRDWHLGWYGLTEGRTSYGATPSTVWHPNGANTLSQELIGSGSQAVKTFGDTGRVSTRTLRTLINCVTRS